MKIKIVALFLLLSNSFAGGLYADGFTPSNLGDAIRHVSDRIRIAHSGGSGKVDLSALERMTDEQRDKAFMVQIDDPERKENDMRREILQEWEKFRDDVANADFSESRKEEILKRADYEIKTYARRIENGFYNYRYERLDNCINTCWHKNDMGEMSCLSKEIETRMECETKSLLNPNRHYCSYQAKKEFESCDKDESWDYQKCQAECHRRN